MTQVSDLFLHRYQHALDEELRETFAGQEGLLYNMILYQLGWIDEQGMALASPAEVRLHPLLCLLSCDALSGKFELALPAAATVELVYNYSLVHEDLQSGSPNRGQRPTAWWIWGPGQAINAGDGMHALARLTLMRLHDREVPIATVLKAIRLLDQSCLSMCEGQHLDLAFQEKLDVGVESYLKMAAGKMGALMSCAMGLGALTANGDDAVVEAFKECGRNLGIAHQIKYDIDEIKRSALGEAPSSNLLNKKKLLPVVYAMETGEIRTKRELGAVYFKRVLEPSDVQQVIGILKERSALEYAHEKLSDHYRRAIESLKGVDLDSRGREELENLCQHITALDL